MKGHTIRLIVATAIGVVLMLVLLMLAVQYAQRDWSQKNRRAWLLGAPKPVDATQTADSQEELPGWTYELLPSATQRQMDRLASDPFIPNGWWILAAIVSAKTDPRLVVSALRMAIAIERRRVPRSRTNWAWSISSKSASRTPATVPGRGTNPARLRANPVQPGAVCHFRAAIRSKPSNCWGNIWASAPTTSSALRLQSTLAFPARQVPGRPPDAGECS